MRQTFSKAHQVIKSSPCSLIFDHWRIWSSISYISVLFTECVIFFLFLFIYIYFQAETSLFHHLRFLDHVGDGCLNTVCTNKLWCQGNTCHYHACLIHNRRLKTRDVIYKPILLLPTGNFTYNNGKYKQS